MLVRDPLLRTISDHNDYMIRGAGRTRKLSLRDKQTLSMRSMALSDYYTILKNFFQSLVVNLTHLVPGVAELSLVHLQGLFLLLDLPR